MSKKRIFTSFAIEDKNLREMLIGQRNNNHSTIEFTDMSVKEPWDSSWKTRCRTRVKGCDGMIVIVTKNSKIATGQLWEVKCAVDEGIPLLGIWGYSNEKGFAVPIELRNIIIKDWTWSNISNWVGSL